jgi:mono/diheme cytochrome c family protein
VHAAGVATAACGWALAAGEPTATTSAGKTLYRKYCGQCHALRAAKAAGFGSNKGLGKDGGPSFNIVRVPFSLSVSLMTQASNGHEQVSRRLKFVQIKQIARFIDTATKGNLVQAQPIDGGV